MSHKFPNPPTAVSAFQQNFRSETTLSLSESCPIRNYSLSLALPLIMTTDYGACGARFNEIFCERGRVVCIHQCEKYATDVFIKPILKNLELANICARP